MLTAGGAAALEAQQLDPGDRAALKQVEIYLNDMRTLTARFIQANPDGSLYEGDLYLRRPGQLRLAYDQAPYVIVAKDGWLIYADKELNQATYLRLDETPAVFLVKDNISLFEGELMVTHFARDDGAYRVRLVRRDNPDAGSATLLLSDSPLTLRKWRIVDARGDVTDTTLIDPESNVPISDTVFDFNERAYDVGN